jgi:large subunit ribosomal protein L5
MPDMLKLYREKVLPAMRKKRDYKSNYQVPRLSKIVINMGIGTQMDKDAMPEAKEHLAALSGQIPSVRKSTKNISNFKLRKGMPVGIMVTLRGKRMYEFLDRLTHNVFPRVRDFRGISKKGFDGSGNYNFGIQDITVFPEIDLDKAKRHFGLNITVVTTAKTDEEAFDLLQMMEMPFALNLKGE